MLAETPVTQRSPCYSAVFSSLTNSLPDCSNYSPFCHTHYLTLQPFTSLFRPDPFTKSLCWRIFTLLQRFTAESSRELMSSEEYRSALRKLNNKQRQIVTFLPLLFKGSPQFPFVSFSFLSISILSLLPLSFLPFLIPLASSPSLLSLLINFLSY